MILSKKKKKKLLGANCKAPILALVPPVIAHGKISRQFSRFVDQWLKFYDDGLTYAFQRAGGKEKKNKVHWRIRDNANWVCFDSDVGQK